MSETAAPFNRRAVALHRARAATAAAEHDFLFAEGAERLADRLDDIRRTFPVALDLGCRTGALGRALGRRGGIETLFRCDLAPAMASRAGPLALAADEELLPFAAAGFDLIVSNLALHWVNDLPGVLAQARRTLKPGGLFLASMLAGATLRELRQAWGQAEAAIEGGISPRVSPMADIRDLGNLLLRAGFTDPVADAETLTVSYADPLRLMADLRAMGESKALNQARKGLTRRTTLLEAAARYKAAFADRDGRVPATFEIVTLTAWAKQAEPE